MSVGDRLCWLGTQPEKNRFGCNSAPTASFPGFLADQNHVHVAQLSCSDNVGQCHPSFSRNSLFTCFWRGLGDFRLWKFRGRPGPETGPKRPKVDFFGLGGRSGRNARRPNLTTFDHRDRPPAATRTVPDGRDAGRPSPPAPAGGGGGGGG